MTIKTFTAGTLIKPSEMNPNFSAVFRAAGLNTVRQLIDRDIEFSAGTTDCFADAYVNSSGREGTVSASSTTAVFDTNKYSAFSGYPYVIIEATSVNAAQFAINNCQCINYETGKWLVYCTTGTSAVRRAQIYKTLFYGTNGTDPRATTTNITGITALRTSVSRDVGKIASLGDTASSLGTSSTFTGTFANTTTNTSCSMWGYVQDATVGATTLTLGATTLISASTTTVDTTGTDTEANEVNNPANFVFNCANAQELRYVVLHVGTISGTATSGTFTYTNFNVTHSIPAMSAVSVVPDSLIFHTIPLGRLPSTISSSCLVTFIQDWETGADIQYKITNGASDPGWLSCGTTTPISNFTAFASEPTTLTIKLIPKSSSPTAGFPSIRGFTLFAE